MASIMDSNNSIEDQLRCALSGLGLIVQGSPEHGLALLRIATLEYLSANGNSEMLSKAVKDFSDGMRLTPRSCKAERTEYGFVFLQALKTRLAKSMSSEDLDTAIETANSLIQDAPSEEPPSWPLHYDILTFYTKKMEIATERSPWIVNAAIDAGETCLKDPHLPRDLRARCHSMLCNLYFNRFNFSGKSMESDINCAVEHGNHCMAGAPPDEASLARWHLLLSRALAARFSFSAQAEDDDIRNAVVNARQAVSEFKKGLCKGLDKAAVLNNLSNRLEDLYTAEGHSNNLEEAIGLAEQVLDLTTDAHDLCVYKQNLVGLLNTGFTALGKEVYINEAIRHGRELIQSNGHNINHERAAYLTVLATALSHRYNLKHGLDDVREAIKYMREAVDLTSPEHATYNTVISNLSKHLKTLYEREKDAGILKEALELQETIIRSSDPKHPDTARLLDLLANSYDDLFLETGQVTYSNKALELGCSVIAARIPPDPSRPTAFTNQSARYWSRWVRLQETSALDQAIDHGRTGVRSYNLGHPNRALVCNNLANMLNARYNLDQKKADRVEALTTYLEAFQQENAQPVIRIEAGRAAGVLYGEDGRWKESSNVLEKCVNMFPRLSPRSVSRGDQQDSIAHLSGISGLACSAAIMAGAPPEDCLGILETGRGVISGLAMFLEDDIHRLQLKHPEVHERFQNLRAVVSQGLPSLEESQARNEEFDDLLGEIRSLDGFATFLLCPSKEDVLSLATRGPIVCLNATELGSHAILVVEGEMSALPLPGLSYQRLEEDAVSFAEVSKVASKTGDGYYKKMNTNLKGLLTRLWETAVGPVLQRLDLLPNANTRTAFPLVYWMPCGLLSHMPIHAAGIYKPGSKGRAADLVASSYITTLKAAVWNHKAASNATNSLWAEPLIISMPKTPTMGDLSAKEESAAICTIINNNSNNMDTPTILTNPSKQQVIQHLPTCTLVHFICHGESSPTDPSQSKLYLGPASSSSSSSSPEILTMAQLAALTRTMPVGRARLAFLSACSTAENASSRLQDEVIHIASAFQLLGFEHVVATLWPASNQAAVYVAERFYRRLVDMEGGGGVRSAEGEGKRKMEEGMAEALHWAVSGLRLGGVPGEVAPKWPPSDILGWAPFVHLGL